MSNLMKLAVNFGVRKNPNLDIIMTVISVLQSLKTNPIN